MRATNVVLFVLLITLAACSAPPLLAPSGSPSAATTATAITPATTAPTAVVPAAAQSRQSPSPTPTLRPTPAPQTAPANTASTLPASFSIGAALGEAYTPYGMAIDPGENVAYIYHASSDTGSAAIAVVDLATQKVTRLMRIGDEPLGPGRLLLAPDGQRLFLQEGSHLALWTIDAQSGAAQQLLDQVRDIALSEDGRLLFAAQDPGLAAYAVEDLLSGKLAPVWQSRSAFDRLAVNGGRLLAGSYVLGSPLIVFDARSGTSLASITAPDNLQAVQRGAGGGWAVVVGGEKPRLIRYDAALEVLGETDIPYANAVSYDARADRFLLGGSRFEGSSSRSYGVVLAITGSDGKVAQEVRWPTVSWPTVFAAWDDDALLAFADGGPALLSVLDAGTLAVRSSIAMGARMDDAVFDGEALYVADDLGRIHVLQLPEGQEVGLWQGSAPLALDAANGRLYANRGNRVVALDLRTGDAVAEFPQAGVPAPDPQRDLVYIADRGVTIYDRSGERLGDLPSTFPNAQGFSPNPAAQGVQVNPVTGHVAVIFYNGISGSNSGTFLRIYEPQSDKYVTPPAPHSFVMDLVSDSQGVWYVAYSIARNQEAVQMISPDGQELRRLEHRTGYLALDQPHDNLYLFTEGKVTRLAASTLTALETVRGPATVGGLVFDPATATAYLFDPSGPAIGVVKLADLAPLDLKPVDAVIRQDASAYGLAVTARGNQRILVGDFDYLYRSGDGANWQRLLPGLDPTYVNITTVDGGTIFVTGRSASGGEGVWRSRDGGDTWEWLTAGLTDLASSMPVLARSADDAYFLNSGLGLLRWDAAGRTWRLVSALEEGQDWTSLALAPDGALFRTTGGYLGRSTDQGATWTTLAPTRKTGEVIGFSALYTVTQTIFSSVRAADYRITAVNRSTDGGQTWQPSLTSAQVELDGFPLQMVTGFGRTYLLTQPYNGQPTLLRTTDYGDTWEAAPQDAAADAGFIAVDPLDGRLWLATNDGVRSVNPDDLRWTSEVIVMLDRGQRR